MAWEIEYEHIDMAEMQHVTGFIERTLKNRNGEPIRHVHTVLLGTDGFSTTRGVGSSNLQLSPGGMLRTPDGGEISVRALQKAELAKITAMHAAARAYARKYGVRHLPAPQKASSGK